MRKIRIFDNSFMGHSKSASLREENADVSPSYFEWTDEGPLTKPTFFTSDSIKDVAKYGSAPGKVAWLLEPRCLRPENYQAAKENQAYFDVILTYDTEFINEVPNAKFYPFGGSSIAFDKWGIYPKSKDICMFVSEKKQTEGHRLRHKIAERFGDHIDLYGAGVGKPVESKFEVLKDYRFEVVVESCFIENYFTEKIVDPVSVGTVPICYRGSNYGFFDEFPIFAYFFFSHQHEMPQNAYEIYEDQLPRWQTGARDMRIIEDYLLIFFPQLFEVEAL